MGGSSGGAPDACDGTRPWSPFRSTNEVVLDYSVVCILNFAKTSSLSLSSASSGAVVTWDAFDDLGNSSLMPGLAAGVAGPPFRHSFCLVSVFSVLFLRCHLRLCCSRRVESSEIRHRHRFRNGPKVSLGR